MSKLVKEFIALLGSKGSSFSDGTLSKWKSPLNASRDISGIVAISVQGWGCATSGLGRKKRQFPVPCNLGSKCTTSWRSRTKLCVIAWNRNLFSECTKSTGWGHRWEASPDPSAASPPLWMPGRTREGNMQSQTMINSTDKRFGPKELNIINPITVKSFTE